MEDLISNYGYFAILLGMLVEGEVVLILGGFLAHVGYLELYWVITVAFAGTLLSDQLFFYLGRYKGAKLLQTYPRWKAKSARVITMLHRHQVWLIIGFRFLWGMRTVVPFLLGISKIKPFKFISLNGIGVLIWSLILGLLGFFLGQTAESWLGTAKKYEMWAAVMILSVSLLVWSVHRLMRERVNG